MHPTAALHRCALGAIRLHGRHACLALLAAAVLSGCGGGGTAAAVAPPETPAPPPASPAPIAVTQANAKALAASALDALWASEIVEGDVALVIGAGNDARGAGPLISSVNDTDTWACPKGNPPGTVAATGPTAGVWMKPGDSVKLVATNCREFAFQTVIDVSGSTVMTLDSGQLQTLTIVPYRYRYHGTFTDLSMSVSYRSPLGNPGVPDDVSVAGSGDMAVEVANGFGMTDINWPVYVGGSETLQASGSALDLQVRSGGSVRPQRWTNYTATVARSNFVPQSGQQYSVAADVLPDPADPLLAGSTYHLSTPSAVNWIRSTGTLSAGALRIDGAKGSSLQMTITAPDTFRLQVDADGDGAFESEQTVTVLQLRPRPVEGQATTAVTAANARAVAANALEVLRASELAETDMDLVTAIELDLRLDPSRQASRPGYDGRTCRGTTAGLVLIFGDLSAPGNEVDYTLTDCAVQSMTTVFVTSGRMTATWLSGELRRFSGPYSLAYASSLRSVVVKPAYGSPASRNDPSLNTPADYAATASGDMTLDVSGDVDAVAGVNVQNLQAAGTRMDLALVYADAARSQRWRNYAITVRRDDDPAFPNRYAFAGFVETDSSRLGSAGGSYNLSTPDALAWSRWDDTVSAGSVRVRGAGGSTLLLTVTAPNTFRLQVDADGDGSFESDATATMGDLKALR